MNNLVDMATAITLTKHETSKAIVVANYNSFGIGVHMYISIDPIL